MNCLNFSEVLLSSDATRSTSMGQQLRSRFMHRGNSDFRVTGE